MSAKSRGQRRRDWTRERGRLGASRTPSQRRDLLPAVLTGLSPALPSSGPHPKAVPGYWPPAFIFTDQYGLLLARGLGCKSRPHVMQGQASPGLCGVSQGGPADMPPATASPNREAGCSSSSGRGQNRKVQSRPVTVQLTRSRWGRVAGRESKAADLHPASPGGPRPLLPPSGAGCPSLHGGLHPAPGHAVTALPGHTLATWACFLCFRKRSPKVKCPVACPLPAVREPHTPAHSLPGGHRPYCGGHRARTRGRGSAHRATRPGSPRAAALRASSHCCRRSADGVLRYKVCWACCSRHTCLLSGLSTGSNTLTVQPARGMVRGGPPSCSKEGLRQHPGLCRPQNTLSHGQTAEG